MPKKIIFHIGLPKTGTTSIQKFMATHYKTLAGEGIFFPYSPAHNDPAYVGEGRGQGPHADMVSCFFDGLIFKGKPSGIDWSTVFDEFHGEKRYHTMAVSHEIQSMRGDRIRRDAYTTAIGDSQATFLVYLREPASWLNSLYIQRLTGTGKFFGPPERYNNIRQYVREGFTGMLAPFDSLGHLDVRNYDALRASDTLLANFLDTIGAVSLKEVSQQAERRNVTTFSPEQLLVLRALKTISGVGADENFILIRTAFVRANRRMNRAGEKIARAQMLNADLVEPIREQWDRDRENSGRSLWSCIRHPCPGLGSGNFH